MGCVGEDGMICVRGWVSYIEGDGSDHVPRGEVTRLRCRNDGPLVGSCVLCAGWVPGLW